MQRMPSIKREELGPEGQAAWDRIAATRGSVRGPFGVLLHHPLLGERVADVGELLRFKGVLPGATRELAIAVVARHMGAAVEWVAHAPLALKEGASVAAVEAVRLQQPTTALEPSEALVIDTARELIADHTLSDARYQQIESTYGRQGLIELTVLVGYYSMLGYVLNTVQVPAAGGVERPFEIATEQPAS
jgi:4-carboxymuconolactone decarboxylase